MNAERKILEKWIGRMADSDPEQAAVLRVSEPDPFRNPVAFAVRKGLSQLLEQLSGEMNCDVIDSALDTIVRIRALQDLSPTQAVGFVAELRSLVPELPTTLDRVVLESRIDRLVLAAFNKYAQCREQIVAVRLHEAERLTRMRLRLAKGCP